MKLRTLLLAGSLSLAAAAAIAAGAFPGYPTASLPLTGNERIPADTGLAQGLSPQTEVISTTTLKRFMFGNAASANGTASSGAVTANGGRGIITTESLTTAAGAVYTLTLTNSNISTSSLVFVSVGYGTASAGTPAVATVTPGSGSVVIKVQNIHASAALNGTLTVDYLVIN